MKRKPIKIDWDALEDAFSNQHQEVVSYLDRVTGRVLLEGEGEEDDLADDDAMYDRGLGSAPPPRDDATRLYVHPPDTAHKVEWMKAFLASDASLDAEVASTLTEALDSDDPAEQISAILKQNPDEREAWFLYRAGRMRTLIDDWLDANGVDVTDAPPWKVES